MQRAEVFRRRAVAMVSTVAGFHGGSTTTALPTFPLLARRFKKDRVIPANTPWRLFDKTGSDSHIHKLEAGSPDKDDSRVSIDDVEDLSKEQVAVTMQKLDEHYSGAPEMYAFTCFSSVDLVLLMARNELIPKYKPEVMVARYFVDPELCLLSASRIEHVMGDVRYPQFKMLLLKELADYAQASPICRAVAALRLPDIWIPFLRGLVSSKTLKKEYVAALCLAIANGKAVSDYALSNDPETRIKQLSTLLLAASCEFGNTTLANLALHLLRANNVTPSRELHKKLTIAVAREEARSNDWKVRTSGMIQQVAPGWLTHYRKKVEGDVTEKVRLLAQSLSADELMEVPDGPPAETQSKAATTELGFPEAEGEGKGTDDATDDSEVETGSPLEGVTSVRVENQIDDSFDTLFSLSAKKSAAEETQAPSSSPEDVKDYVSTARNAGFHEVYLTSLQRTLRSKQAETISVHDASKGDQPKNQKGKKPGWRKAAGKDPNAGIDRVSSSAIEEQQKRLRKAMEASGL
jgi:hypothetical protein